MRDEKVSTTQRVGQVMSPPWLFIDLDQSLLRGDLLWEGLAGLLRSAPLRLLALPLWLLSGRAIFKQRLSEAVSLSPSGLPFRSSVIEYVHAAQAQGRSVVLASASPRIWVQAVADHLGCFDGILASDGQKNLKGSEKLAAIRACAGEEPFEYVGDSSADIPIWNASAVATLVGPGLVHEKKLASGPSVHILPEVESLSWGGGLFREVRPSQWVKNALVFAPLILAHEWADGARLIAVGIAFVAFCCAASMGYILNDLIDLESDRLHPEKCSRPLASGEVSIPMALALLLLLTAGFTLLCVFFLTLATTGMLLIYLSLTFTYSFYFKRQLLLDTLVLAGLYTHRLLTGGIAADVTVSPWLLVFSAFLFLSLALVKRFSELLAAPESKEKEQEVKGRAYRKGDMSGVRALGQACGLVAILVLCLYVSGQEVARLYPAPEFLWAMVPVMFYWITRIWILAWRGDLPGDPVLFAVHDGPSYLCGAIMLVSLALATWL